MRALLPSYIGRKVNAGGVIVAARESDLLACDVKTGDPDLPDHAAEILLANRGTWAAAGGHSVAGASDDFALSIVKPTPPPTDTPSVLARVRNELDKALAEMPEPVRLRVPGGDSTSERQIGAWVARAAEFGVPVESIVRALVHEAADSITQTDEADHFVTPEDRALMERIVRKQREDDAAAAAKAPSPTPQQPVSTTAEIRPEEPSEPDDETPVISAEDLAQAALKAAGMTPPSSPPPKAAGGRKGAGAAQAAKE